MLRDELHLLLGEKHRRKQFNRAGLVLSHARCPWRKALVLANCAESFSCWGQWATPYSCGWDRLSLPGEVISVVNCLRNKLLSEQEMRFREVGLRPRELVIACLPWVVALRAAHALRTWSGLPSASSVKLGAKQWHLSLWAVSRAHLNTVVIVVPG